jgi:hypothetical protein
MTSASGDSRLGSSVLCALVLRPLSVLGPLSSLALGAWSSRNHVKGPGTKDAKDQGRTKAQGRRTKDVICVASALLLLTAV